MEPQRTDAEPDDYLRSLTITAAPTEVYGLNGAALYRVDDGHFVIMECTDPEHPTHNGHALLRRVIPAAWSVFYLAHNPDEHYTAHHYGPVDQ